MRTIRLCAMLRFLIAVAFGPASLGEVVIPTHTIAPGVAMPVVSIGTGGTEEQNASVIVKNWMSLGGRGVDTAHIYNDQVEVAKAIADAGVERKDVFITSKIPGCAMAEKMVREDLSQLGTEYIDLMLIHYPGGGDCSRTWAVLEEFHAKGVLRTIGVSNFNASTLSSLLKTAKVVPAVNQIRLNVLSHDDETISVCKANNITVEAYSPLGRHSGEIPANREVQNIAAAHNVTTFQVAMRWILQHGYVLTFQSASKEHQEADADVFGFTLTEADMATLDRLQSAAQSWEAIVV